MTDSLVYRLGLKTVPPIEIVYAVMLGICGSYLYLLQVLEILYIGLKQGTSKQR